MTDLLSEARAAEIAACRSLFTSEFVQAMVLKQERALLDTPDTEDQWRWFAATMTDAAAEEAAGLLLMLSQWPGCDLTGREQRTPTPEELALALPAVQEFVTCITQGKEKDLPAEEAFARAEGIFLGWDNVFRWEAFARRIDAVLGPDFNYITSSEICRFTLRIRPEEEFD